MPVRQNKIVTLTGTAPGSTAAFNIGAVDVRGYSDLTVHVTNANATTALLTIWVDPTGTTAPTSSSSLHVLSDSSASTQTITCSANSVKRSVALSYFGCPTGNFIFITAALSSGTGTIPTDGSIVQNG